MYSQTTQQGDSRLITLKPLLEIHQALRKILLYFLKLVTTHIAATLGAMPTVGKCSAGLYSYALFINLPFSS